MLIPALAILVFVGLSLLAYARFIEPAWLRVRHRIVPVVGLPDASVGVRILHLSDLHVGRSTGRLRRFLARAAVIPADIVVITGDFVDHPGYLPQLSRVLEALVDGTRPVLAIMGNHDRFYYSQRLVRSRPHAYDSTQLIATVREAGVDLLLDETRTLATRAGEVTFVGVDIVSHDSAGLERALQGFSSRGTIMLAHSPDAIGPAAEAGVALLLCGHTHGGQVRIGPWLTPMTSTRIPIKPPSGISVRGATTMHVSPGLGTTFLPFRFFARPEATVLELAPGNPENL
jgi:uncharacterized protein